MLSQIVTDLYDDVDGFLRYLFGISLFWDVKRNDDNDIQPMSIQSNRWEIKYSEKTMGNYVLLKWQI